MNTLTQMVEAKRQPLVVRWELVTDAHGRTRPQMRWQITPQTTGQAHGDDAVSLAA